MYYKISIASRKLSNETLRLMNPVLHLKKRSIILSILSLMFHLLIVFPSAAKVVRYDLTVDYKTMNYTGRDVQAMSLNDSIPGPTLRFTEGDVAHIRIHNNMDVPTSIHWHGILPHRLCGRIPCDNRPEFASDFPAWDIR